MASTSRNPIPKQACTACGFGKNLICRQPKCKCLCHTVDERKDNK